MPKTLRDLKGEGDRLRTEGKLKEALKVYRLVLEGAPLDFDLRLQIADLLKEIAPVDVAAAVYTSIAEHDIRSGNPLRAMVAIKKLISLGFQSDHLTERVAVRYASGADALGRGVRPAPINYDVPVREDIDLNYSINDEELVADTAKRAAYLDNIQNYPKVVPPVSLFSSLEREAFVQLLQNLILVRHNPGTVIIEQGSRGDSIFFLARGEVGVYKTADSIDATKKEVPLARLGPGSLFGEMALVSNEPRGASVISGAEVDVLELKCGDLNTLSQRLPAVAQVMERFTRERMISNLLATNPLFEPFPEEQKKQLLGRFKGHDVPSGTVFLEEGDTGKGLYIILRGNAEVIKWDDGAYIKLAELGPGSLVGEMSLLFEEPVSATVRTTGQATLLFLARELFKPLLDSVPDLLAHFSRLAEKRRTDTEQKIGRSRDEIMELSVEDLELEDDLEEEGAIELDDDDVVFI